ncbi:MAG: EpsI family protein [Candidatus Omnitrophota bacterium]|jgi:EpsI family protein|nr:MAG: EpsI family protein [Candidatus Omnitrophota bacterium]
MKNKTFYIAAAVLLFTSVVCIVSYFPSSFDKSEDAKVATFPKEINGWVARDLEISERDYKILETRNLFVREYTNAAQEKVYFYFIYSLDNRKVSHPPEICYMGSGVTVVDKSTVQLTDKIKAVKLIIEKADHRQLVAYWFQAGAFNTHKYLLQQLRVVLNRAVGKQTPNALIRLSADFTPGQEGKALNTLKAFTRDIEPSVSNFFK